MGRGFTCAGCGGPVAFSAPGCECGGLLELEPATGPWTVDDRAPGLWRYRSRLPFDPGWDGWRRVTMGEGSTALVEVDGALAKVEYASPTLSFKDRGACMLVARAVLGGAEHVLVDSSGNAGTAVAAYAARAGLPCTVVAPAATSPAKLAQVRAHGARLRLVEGTRKDVAAAARAEVTASGAWYASHVLDPTFYEGTKTMAFEVFEQLGRLPDVVVLPVGNGTLVLGWARGAAELVEAGLVASVSRVVAVQARGCAPVAAAWASGAEDVGPVATGPTLAEGIAIAAPPRGAAVLAAVRASGGAVLEVDDGAILAARARLARAGFYVEPTAAATWASLVQVATGSGSGELVLAPLCGAGLKAPG